MRKHMVVMGCIASMSIVASVTDANVIARFTDPLPGGGGETMFLLGLYGSRLYGGWMGPPRITLETPAGTFPDCTMWLPPMHVDPDGRVWGGQMVFYLHNQTEILRIGFTNGHVDSLGFGAGPQTGGTVTSIFAPGGVQVPAGLSEPLQGGSFYFQFHNPLSGPSGPEYTASFSCAAQGIHGDLNCDGAVNTFDIDPFVAALTAPTGYATAYPFCDVQNADINGDGVVNSFDVDPFVALLTG
jgi:hypothetical protein